MLKILDLPIANEAKTLATKKESVSESKSFSNPLRNPFLNYKSKIQN